MLEKSKLLSRLILAALFCLALFAWIAVAKAQGNPDLAIYKNARFGFELRYPAAIFEPGQPPGNGDGLTFTSRDGKAKIVTYAAFNADGLKLKAYRAALMEEYRDRYELLDYQPQGKTWFVLSGYRGETVFYEKVMFSCGGDIVNVIAITYPRAEEAFYNPVVEQLENGFKTGRGEDTTPKCE